MKDIFNIIIIILGYIQLLEIVLSIIESIVKHFKYKRKEKMIISERRSLK